MIFAEAADATWANVILSAIALLTLLVKWLRDERIAKGQNAKLDTADKKLTAAESQRAIAARNLIDATMKTAQTAREAKEQVAAEAAEIKRKIDIVKSQTNGLPARLQSELDKASEIIELMVAKAENEERFDPNDTVVKDAKELIEKKKSGESGIIPTPPGVK